MSSNEGAVELGYHIIKKGEYDKSNKVDLEISIRPQIIVHSNSSEKYSGSWKQDSIS
ncbi:MAG: hypothetical protein ACRD9Q_02975 [Nitrososphaeraceae archaeon]